MTAKKTTGEVEQETDALQPTDLVDALDLAKLLGVHVSTLQTFRNNGMPVHGRGKNMKYSPKECIHWYISYHIEKETAKLKAQIPTRTEMDKEEAITRKLVAEALIKEVELERLRETLVNHDDAEKELAKHLGVVRQALLSFPARVAPYLVGITSELDAREMMQNKVADLMHQMAKQVEELEEMELEDEELENDE